MKSFLFWQRWLLFVGILVAVFGLVMAILNGTSIFSLFNDQINPVFWGRENVPHTSLDFQRWVYGAWGATVSGWGVFLGFIASYPFRKQEKWARNCLVTGLGMWFLVDTSISIYYRVDFNVIFNSVLALLVILPLGATWKMFDEELSIDGEIDAA